MSWSFCLRRTDWRRAQRCDGLDLTRSQWESSSPECSSRRAASRVATNGNTGHGPSALFRAKSSAPSWAQFVSECCVRQSDRLSMLAPATSPSADPPAKRRRSSVFDKTPDEINEWCDRHSQSFTFTGLALSRMVRRIVEDGAVDDSADRHARETFAMQQSVWNVVLVVDTLIVSMVIPFVMEGEDKFASPDEEGSTKDILFLVYNGIMSLTFFFCLYHLGTTTMLYIVSSYLTEFRDLLWFFIEFTDLMSFLNGTMLLIIILLSVATTLGSVVSFGLRNSLITIVMCGIALAVTFAGFITIKRPFMLRFHHVVDEQEKTRRPSAMRPGQKGSVRFKLQPSSTDGDASPPQIKPGRQQTLRNILDASSGAAPAPAAPSAEGDTRALESVAMVATALAELRDGIAELREELKAQRQHHESSPRRRHSSMKSVSIQEGADEDQPTSSGRKVRRSHSLPRRGSSEGRGTLAEGNIALTWD